MRREPVNFKVSRFKLQFFSSRSLSLRMVYVQGGNIIARLARDCYIIMTKLIGEGYLI